MSFFAFAATLHHSTVFVVSLNSYADRAIVGQDDGLVKYGDSLNRHFSIERFISLRDRVAHQPPEHVPDDIGNIFGEAASCLSVECWNAAGCMFRACIDLATRPLLPEQETEGLDARTRRDLGLRLPWLFKTGRLPADLSELSACIREYGNDGAHAGTLKKADAEDLMDFTLSLLDRIYTEPGRLLAAKERREKRRGPGPKP